MGQENIFCMAIYKLGIYYILIEKQHLIGYAIIHMQNGKEKIIVFILQKKLVRGTKKYLDMEC